MLSKALLVFGIALFALAVPLRANYFTNTDFGVDLSGWHGDGEKAYLKADGTEGDDTDADAIPVIKIALAHGHSHYVSQEIDLTNKPDGVHVQVEMYVSADFQRSKFDSDYTVPQHFPVMWEYDEQTINSDFWIRMGPSIYYDDWNYTSGEAKQGKWVTVKAYWPAGQKAGDHFTVNFCVPPGEGTVYLKNPVADK
jgi:hypothetical protein